MAEYGTAGSPVNEEHTDCQEKQHNACQRRNAFLKVLLILKLTGLIHHGRNKYLCARCHCQQVSSVYCMFTNILRLSVAVLSLWMFWYKSGISKMSGSSTPSSPVISASLTRFLANTLLYIYTLTVGLVFYNASWKFVQFLDIWDSYQKAAACVYLKYDVGKTKARVIQQTKLKIYVSAVLTLIFLLMQILVDNAWFFIDDFYGLFLRMINISELQGIAKIGLATGSCYISVAYLLPSLLLLVMCLLISSELTLFNHSLMAIGRAQSGRELHLIRHQRLHRQIHKLIKYTDEVLSTFTGVTFMFLIAMICFFLYTIIWNNTYHDSIGIIWSSASITAQSLILYANLIAPAQLNSKVR